MTPKDKLKSIPAEDRPDANKGSVPTPPDDPSSPPMYTDGEAL